MGVKPILKKRRIFRIKLPSDSKISSSYYSSESESPSHAVCSHSLSSTLPASQYCSPASHTNTLSMISSPWSTESWVDTIFSPRTFDLSRRSWCGGAESTKISSSLRPKSSTYYGVPSPSLKTITSFTLYDVASIPTGPSMDTDASGTIDTLSDTFSSWSIETFTSDGGAMISEHDVRATWSSFSGDTDIYPSTSIVTTRSQFSSKDTTLSAVSLKKVTLNTSTKMDINAINSRTKPEVNGELSMLHIIPIQNPIFDQKKHSIRLQVGIQKKRGNY